MLHNACELPQHIYLALDRHQELLKDAKRQREANLAQRWNGERPLRWRRLRYQVGALLINMGQRLKGGTADASSSTDVVWG